MPTVERSTFRTILLALQAEIVARTGFATSRVIITCADPADVGHLGARQDILIQPQDEDPVGGIMAGGGRYDSRRTRRLSVYCRTRLNLDRNDSDVVRLTDDSLGHIVLEDMVYDACCEFFAIDDTGSSYVASGAQLGRFSRPTPDRDDRAWVSSYLEVSYEYTRNLDLTR